MLLYLPVCAFAQTDSSLSFRDYSTHVLFHFGVIRNEVKTTSENNTIHGSPGGDSSIGLSIFYYFKNHRAAISLQASHAQYSSQYFTNNYASYSGSGTGVSAYYKLGLNFNYSMKLNKKVDLLLYAGPSLLIQRVTGKYGHYETRVDSLIKPPAHLSTADFYKIEKTTFASQFGANLFYKVFKRNVLSLNIGYSLGFQDFYEGRISAYLYSNGTNVDNAVIRGRGNGFYGYIGFSLPLIERISRNSASG